MTKGYSLLEALIAISLLLFSSLAIMSLFSKGSEASYKARTMTTSYWLAKEKMEEVCATPWNFIEHPELNEGFFSSSFSNYGFKIKVEDFDISPNLKRIQVTVIPPARCEIELLTVVRI